MERVVDPRSSRTTASAWRNPARRYFEPDHGGKSGVQYGACGGALYVPLWLHGPQVLRKGSRLPGQSDARKRHAGCVPSLDAFLSDNTKLEGSFLFFLSQACRNLPKYIRKASCSVGPRPRSHHEHPTENQMHCSPGFGWKRLWCVKRDSGQLVTLDRRTQFGGLSGTGLVGASGFEPPSSWSQTTRIKT